MVEQREYTAGWFDYQTSDVCLSFWKGNTRSVERIPFKWYFYLLSSDMPKVEVEGSQDKEFIRKIDSRAHRKFLSMVDDVKYTEDKRYAKIYTNSKWDNRKDIATWLMSYGKTPLEADVTPLNRLLIDYPVRFSSTPRVLFFDLETDPRSGWGAIEKQRILAVAYETYDEKRECIVAETDDDKGERDLLEKFLAVVAEHDLLVAWNGDAFDEVVLKERIKHVGGLKVHWNMINFLDFMQLFKHPYFGYGRDADGSGLKMSYALGNVAEMLLGISKVKEVAGYKMHEVWQKDKELLREYNLRDVEIMSKLEKKFGYISSLVVVSHMCNRFVSSWSLRMGYLNDAYVLRYGNEHGIHFPTKWGSFEKPAWNKPIREFEGAFIMNPVVGLHENVCDMDFSSLYPSIIRTFNISPETKLLSKIEASQTSQTRRVFSRGKAAVASNGFAFRNDEQGVFPAIIAMAMDKRKEFKKAASDLEKAGKGDTLEWRKTKQKSDAYKLISNGSYGCLGSPFLRYYDPDCAEAVTLTAQETIKSVIELGKQAGVRTIYSDTDSVFLKCPEKVAMEFVDVAALFLDDWVKSKGGKPGFLRLAHDATYERIFFTTKKRYAGRRTTGKPGKPDVKGLEFIRSDGCAYSRKFQKTIIDYVLDSPRPTAVGAKAIVKSWLKQLFSGVHSTEDLVITQSLNKSLDEYKTRGVHVDVAQRMLDNGKEIFVGMKIPYIITGKVKSKLQAVHVDDYKGNHDAMLYWVDKVYPATQRILEAVFPKEDWKEFVHLAKQMKVFNVNKKSLSG